ncbi:peroxidasin homolog [Pseudomyrmex gracilis]|uniref:peroxidasin homolog n=1 Tax=Pseudomyrmex gracilis TaxID=219809 RepID=UPI000995D1C5|nr:peroxidasin homolog [Pseudomyrmex gracilis]
MRRETSFVVLLVCICALVDAATATCTVTKHEDGRSERLKCFNVTLQAISNGSFVTSDILIFQSSIETIPDRAFLKYNENLISLNVHDCGIKEISSYAFDGLRYLKKIGLSYNNITNVRYQWFVGLTSLEQLDLSYNHVASIEPDVFKELRGLRRLDVRGNRLTCLEPVQLAPMTGLEKLRFSGNPLTFRCRSTLTLWLQDLGIGYRTEQRGEDDWLDNILWLCTADDGKVAESEILMKECVILNLFNQLRTGLSTAESSPLFVPQDCIYMRNQLTQCVARNYRHGREVVTNGHVVRKLLRQLYETKSTV